MRCWQKPPRPTTLLSDPLTCYRLSVFRCYAIVMQMVVCRRPARGKEKELSEILPSGQYPNETNLTIRRRRHETPLHMFDVAAGTQSCARCRCTPAARELIGARLYTGPMFQKCVHVFMDDFMRPLLSSPTLRNACSGRYNTVIRGVGKDRPDWCIKKFKELCYEHIHNDHPCDQQRHRQAGQPHRRYQGVPEEW